MMAEDKEKKKAVHIVGADVENLYRIRVAHLEMEPGGGLKIITGKNKEGKSSLLRTMAGAIGGKKLVAESPVHTESEDGTGHVRMRLSNDFRIERVSTPSNPRGKLTVVGPDGGQHGQTLLDEWLGTLTFEPLALFGFKAEKQTEILLSLGTNPELPAELKELGAQRQQVYDERIPFNKLIQRAQRATPPEGDRPEPVDVTAENEELGRLLKVQAERQAAAGRHATAQRDVEANVTAQDQQAEAILQAEQALAQAQEVLAKADNGAEFLVKERKGLEATWAERSADLEAIPDPGPEITEVRARLAEVDALHEALEPWVEWDRGRQEMADATAHADDLTATLRALDQQKASMLAEAGIDIPGLSFSDDGAAMLGGQPLELASQRERVVMAARAAVLANPELRACFIDEANSVDEEGMLELMKLAEEEDFQIFLVRLEPSVHGEIITVEDGEAQMWEPGPMGKIRPAPAD